MHLVNGITFSRSMKKTHVHYLPFAYLPVLSTISLVACLIYPPTFRKFIDSVAQSEEAWGQLSSLRRCTHAQLHLYAIVREVFVFVYSLLLSDAWQCDVWKDEEERYAAAADNWVLNFTTFSFTYWNLRIIQKINLLVYATATCFGRN